MLWILNTMKTRARIVTSVAVIALLLPLVAAEKVDLDVIHRIKAEAFAHSKVMDHLFYLADVNGPRVTNSPGYRKAVEWCMKRLRDYGLENVRTEKWRFGKGWTYSRFSAHLLEPAYAPLIGFPLAWTPGTDGPVTGEPVLAVLKEQKDLEKYKGKLRGKIVLIDEPRPLKLWTEPPGKRYTPEELQNRWQAPAPSPPRRRGPAEARRKFTAARNRFLRDEGALAVLRISYKGEAGLVAGSSGGSYKPGDPVPPPMAALTAEHYNRIARLLEKKIPVKLELNIQARIDDRHLQTSNVVAEIPGGNKKDEIVMLGAHLDSWHGGTGATDNGAGVAVVMEAVRILKALNLKMDRTVRLALWAGEEEGLLGSKAYVKAHFADPETMVLKPEHARLSAYFNLDNGSGKIRGIYLQGNDMLRPVFAAWLAPFHDLGATTVALRNTGGTDHLSFDAVGLPGFQFIQDPLEYGPITHHTNMDVYDHAQAGDLMQAAAIMASFVYDAATRPEMLPRKPLPKPRPKQNSAKKTNKES